MTLTQCLRRCSFQEQAKPALESANTRAFKPHDGNSKYPWKHGASSSPFMLETAAGKPGFGSHSLLEHVRVSCICQEQMRHLQWESTWSQQRPEQFAQASCRRGAPGDSQAVHVDVDDRDNTNVEGVLHKQGTKPFGGH